MGQPFSIAARVMAIMANARNEAIVAMHSTADHGERQE